MYIYVIFDPNQAEKPQGNKVVQYFEILNSVLRFAEVASTGCPVNWYSLSISIPDFSDCPIKKM